MKKLVKTATKTHEKTRKSRKPTTERQKQLQRDRGSAHRFVRGTTWH